jgi:hypothetical protein
LEALADERNMGYEVPDEQIEIAIQKSTALLKCVFGAKEAISK